MIRFSVTSFACFLLAASCSGAAYNKPMDGSPMRQDPTDPIFKTLAEESLKKYLQDVGSDQQHYVLQVTSASVQVVSGLITKLQFRAAPSDRSAVLECSSETWEQPWLERTEILKVACYPVSAGGAPQGQDPSGPKYKKMAEVSLNKYLQDVGSDQQHNVLQVTSASVQVVSGLITRLQFRAAPSDRSAELECSSETWEQPWLERTEILKVTCSPM